MIDNLCKLKSLRKLHLFVRGVDFKPSIRDLSKLEELKVFEERFTESSGWENLGFLISLKRLTLNYFPNNFDFLKKLAHLEEFSCRSFYYSLAPLDMSPFFSLPNLKKLRLHIPKIEDNFFQLLSANCALECLQLECPAKLSTIGNLVSLTHLSLENFELGETQTWDFLSSLTRLKLLRISSRTFKAQDAQFLSGLKSLEFLDLNNTLIDSTSIEYITSLVKLNSLYLELNQNLTDECMEEIKKLPNLRKVSFLGCARVSNFGLLNLYKGNNSIYQIIKPNSKSPTVTRNYREPRPPRPELDIFL